MMVRIIMPYPKGAPPLLEPHQWNQWNQWNLLNQGTYLNFLHYICTYSYEYNMCLLLLGCIGLHWVALVGVEGGATPFRRYGPLPHKNHS
jgi:hypothetical protein